MKIGIITFHFPWNCGATLQCTALQTKLEKMGHEAVVIDYSPLYHVNRYSTYKHPVYLAKRAARRTSADEPLPPRLKRAAVAWAKTVKSWSKHAANAERADRFESFQKAHLHMTRRYRTIDELRSNPPKLDMYISGSDQLWNAKITDGHFDPAYFMDFGDSSTARITYAVGADFAAVKFPQSKLIHLVDKIDAISLREEKCLPTVKAACEYIGQGDKPLHIDIDPTLLLDAADYEPFMSPNVEPEPYIYVYTMPSPSQAVANKAAKALAEKTGLHLIDACGNPLQGNRQIEDSRVCGPDEFLSYVNNARYLVTSSFHGTAFAIIFRKQFVAIPHTDTGNRVTELLDKLGLSDRVAYTASDAVAKFDTPIDYEAMEPKLSALRAESEGYLRDCIERFCGPDGARAGR
jgi:hypothetical protein